MTQAASLKRELGLFGAVMMGLGSILGTGVFVSIGIAAGVAGPAVILAIAIAALVAISNGLNSAQLAANHPVSGGTYEYGYTYLNHWFGFIAGWTFLLAKTASAATAALGFATYLRALLGDGLPLGTIPLGLLAVLLLTIVVLSGLRRSNLTNIIIVSITVGALLLFILGGLPSLNLSANDKLQNFFGAGENPLRDLLQAAALMFVAYTGYGRIATLGEEVRQPRRTIPRAIITTLLVTMALYMGVGLVAVAAVGAANLSDTAQQVAPLVRAAEVFAAPWIAVIVALGAITAMLGVLLNLILGLSRVLLAMGRRGDMPTQTARLNASQTTPTVAVMVVGLMIAALVLVGNVKTTWSFSAFTVLIYYAITNLSALRLSNEARLFPRWIAWLGLSACLFLAFWVEPQIWLVGLGLLGIGLLWHSVARRFQPRTA